MKRLRDETSSDFVKSLLDSAAADVPPPQAEERALRAAHQQLMIPKAWPRGWVIGGTIVGIGGLLLLLGQAYQGGHAPAPPAVKPTPVEPSVTEPAVVLPAPTRLPTAAPSISVVVPASGASPGTAIAHPSVTRPSASAVPSARVDTPLGLRDELALIDEARTQLTVGSATAALATLARYDARYPQGLLREEATAVRVEALFAAGKVSEARSTGEAFLREHPQSTHAQHVRTLLDSHAP